MKINKILMGLAVAGICGAGITAMASNNNNQGNKSVEVKPASNTVAVEVSANTLGTVTASDIEGYIANKYGDNWCLDLASKYGDEWDDILEDELESYYGRNYDDIIEDIIDCKESYSGLDDDIYDEHNNHDNLRHCHD